MPAWASWPLVGLATACSIALGLHDLASRSIWLDEGFTWVNSAQPAEKVWRVASISGGHLAPYYLLVHLVVSHFGDSAFVMRLPSVLAGAAAVPVVYLLGCRLAASRVAGVYAAFLLAVSSPFVYWQQNARVYAFVVLLAVTSSLAMVVAVQQRSTWALVGWAAATGLACYMHPDALFVAAAQLVVFFAWPQARAMWRPLVIIAETTVIAAMPVVMNAIDSSDYRIQGVPSPSSAQVREIATFLASGAGTPAGVDSIDYALLGLSALVWVAGLGLLIADLRRHGRSLANYGLALALAWLVLPPLLALAASATGRNSFLDRYLIVSLPAAALVMAVVLARIRPRTFGVFGLVYLVIFRFGVILPAYAKPADDFAKAAQLVAANSRPGDCMTFYEAPARVAFDYYAGRAAAQIVVAEAAPGRRPEMLGGPRALPRQLFPTGPTSDAPSVVLAYESVPAWWPAVAVGAGAKGVPTSCRRLWILETSFHSSKALVNGLRLTRADLAPRYRNIQNFFVANIELQLYRRV